MGHSHRAAGEPVGRSALGRVAEVDAHRFAELHWGRLPLLSKAIGRFDDLLDADAVDELVSSRGLRTPFLRMAKDGSVIAAQRYTRGGGAGATITDQAADDKVLALLGDGATLVLQALHRSWPPLVSFASELAVELGHPVQVNAYVTPPQSQGFAAHYDVHDVFVLQVAGRKQWWVHEPVVTNPLADQNWEKHRPAVAARAAEPPTLEVVLEPGDALYLPRGYLHSANALGELSIHLTVGIHPVTRARLVRQLLEATKADPALRSSLPMGIDLADPAVLAPLLIDTVAAVHRRLDEVEPGAVAQALGAELVVRTRPEPLSPLANLAVAAALTLGTRLRMRAGLRGQVNRDTSHLHLRLIDKSVSLPIAAELALKAVLSGGELTPADLPGLDPDEQLVIARRLLREGVLVPAQ